MRRFLFLLLALGAPLAGAAGEQFQTVMVQEAPVRTEPSYFAGETLATLVAGQKVKTFETQGAWMRVEIPKGRGWVSASAFGDRKVQMKAGTAAGREATGEEMALAVRGWNADLEKEMRSGNASLDYATVDRMEQTDVYAPEEIALFLREGLVMPPSASEPKKGEKKSSKKTEKKTEKRADGEEEK